MAESVELPQDQYIELLELALPRADTAPREKVDVEIEMADVIAWADGVRAASGTELSGRIAPEEYELADKILRKKDQDNG